MLSRAEHDPPTAATTEAAFEPFPNSRADVLLMGEPAREPWLQAGLQTDQAVERALSALAVASTPTWIDGNDPGPTEAEAWSADDIELPESQGPSDWMADEEPAAETIWGTAFDTLDPEAEPPGAEGGPLPDRPQYLQTDEAGDGVMVATIQLQETQPEDYAHLLPVAIGQAEQSDDPVEGPHVSARLAEFEAFRMVAGDVEEKLKTLGDLVSVSRLIFGSMQSHLGKLEGEMRAADDVQAERDVLAAELADMRLDAEAARRELSASIDAMKVVSDRNAELRLEVDQRRNQTQELSSKLDRLRKENDRNSADLAVARAEVMRLSASVEREIAEKNSLLQVKADLGGKVLRLQQAETQARNRAQDLAIQHDKLSKAQPALVADTERLKAELRQSQRERMELQNRLSTAEDRLKQIENENQSLQGYSASEAFAWRTELEMHKAALRTSERAIIEADTRNKEIQRQLRDAEAAKTTAETQVSLLQEELDQVRRERSDAAYKLSDVNLKYMSDLLTLDQEREQNKLFQADLDALSGERKRLSKYEALYRTAEAQMSVLKQKLALMAEAMKPSAAPEIVSQSLAIADEVLQEAAAAAPVEKPTRSTARKSASH